MIVVVGNLRSGTSRIAHWLQFEFGIPMGTKFVAPVLGPSQFYDIEDSELSEPVYAGKFENNLNGQAKFLAYVASRQAHFVSLNTRLKTPAPNWGVKCCGLLSYLDLIPEFATIVTTKRPVREMTTSTARWLSRYQDEVKDTILDYQLELTKFQVEVEHRAKLVVEYSTPKDEVIEMLHNLLDGEK